MTLETLDRVTAALGVPLSRLFEKLGPEPAAQSVPLQCYELVSAQSPEDQARLYGILRAIDDWKGKPS